MSQTASVPNEHNFCLPIPQNLENELVELVPFSVRPRLISDFPSSHRLTSYLG